MDAFQMIQNFFTRMRCNFCSHSFAPEDIQLLRQDDAVYIVNVYCNHCRTQNGVAVVGVEMNAVPGQPPRRGAKHPELPPREQERLSRFQAVSADDVLDAHTFFSGLGDDWMKWVPPEMRQRCTVKPADSPAE